MVHTFVLFSAKVKRSYHTLLPDTTIRALFLQHPQPGRKRRRKRKLDPVNTVYLFLLQILNLNTAITHLRHLADVSISAGAYCTARAKLSVSFMEALLDYTTTLIPRQASQRWCGRRVLLMDGTTALAPDTPIIRKTFRQPANIKPGCGFPMPKVLAVVDAATGLFLQPLICSLFDHEARHAWKLHPLLEKGDVLVGDRGFCSFVHLALLAAGGLDAVLRVQQKQTVNFRVGRKHGAKGQPTSRWVKRLGHCDQLVQWQRPEQRPKWVGRRQFKTLPQTLLVRELRYDLKARGQRTQSVTIVTTLLDPLLYPKEKIAELYGLRWRIEVYFRHAKTTMAMRRLKCRTVEGVKRELLMYFIAYNLTRKVMWDAAQAQGIDPDRISFADALRLLSSRRDRAAGIVLIVVPHRPNRHEPRVKKNLNYRYRTMTKPRRILKRKPYLYADKVK